MRPHALILVLLLAAAAHGQVVPDGRYLLVSDRAYLVTVQSGRLSVEPLQSLVPSTTTPTTPTDPPTRPPVDPPEPPDTQFGQQLAADARRVNEPAMASALSQAFYALAGQIEDQKIKGVVQISDVTKAMLDTILSVSSKKTQWRSVRDSIGDELTKRANNGQLATVGQYAGSYREIGDALAAAGDPNSAAARFPMVKLLLAILSKDPAAIATAIADLLEAIRERRQ